MKVKITGWIKKLINFVLYVFNAIGQRIFKSIRAELMFVFIVSLFLAIFAASISDSLFLKNERFARIDYSRGIQRMDDAAKSIKDCLDNSWYDTSNNMQEIQELIDQRSSNNNISIVIASEDGSVLYKTNGVHNEEKVNIYDIINESVSVKNIDSTIKQTDRKEFVNLYTVKFKDKKTYLIVRGIPEGYIMYDNHPYDIFAVSLSIGVGTFILVFLVLTRGKMEYIKEIANGLIEISKGNLNYRVAIKNTDELGSLAGNINNMAFELKNMIEKEREAENTKNELITNVSHDLRTPLTSIMGYLKLLIDKKYEDEMQLNDYLNIAYSKSEKLNGLINDLFEYTKLSDGGMTFDFKKLCINQLLEQLTDEYAPLFEENGLKMIKEISSDKIYINADGDKLVRVFENLFMNSVRYSIKPGEVGVKMYSDGDNVLVSVENKSDQIDRDALSHVFERFYRLDKSRSSETGGSGLGLAIAKSIVALHGGQIWAECHDDAVSFKVCLKKESLSGSVD